MASDRAPRTGARAGRLARAGVVAAWALGSMSCAIHRGEWSRGREAAAGEAAADERAPRILVIGDLSRGREGEVRAVAAALGRRLDAAALGGPPVIVVHVGDEAEGRGCARPSPATAALLAQIAAHRARGGASFTIDGERERRCAAWPEEAAAWARPGANAVIRVTAEGRAAVIEGCAGAAPTCAAAAAAAGEGTLDLVVVDTVAWLRGEGDAAGDPAVAEAEATAGAAAAMAASSGPERVLVTHHPIESAGPHGSGGRWPDSALHLHAPALQRAIVEGAFIGAISGHERGLQAASDVSAAVKRSSRVWLRAPVWQVIAGGAASGDAGRGARSWRVFQGQSLAPEHRSNYPGFAEIEVHAGRLEVTLHARRLGRWERARLSIARGRPPHPTESASPVMDPCAGCDPRAPRW